MKCEFCENLEFQKVLDSANNEIINAYSVAFVVRSWTEAKGEERAGRITDYRDKGKGYQLNYCPECGRKIEEE